MSEENQPSGPDFDWSPVNDLFCYFEPEEWWVREWEGYPELGKQLRHLIELAVRSLEGLSSKEAAEVQQVLKESPQCWGWAVDWWYCKDAVTRIIPITERFMQLSPILTLVGHQQEVNVYLREATKCYLYGFFQASTALFRTALETGLKDCFDRKLDPRPGVKLFQRITQAVTLGLIPAHVGSMANEVKDAANRVIHEEPITEQQAFDVLVKTRCVLEELYKS